MDSDIEDEFRANILFAGVSDPDCQANGQEELSGEEPGSRGDPRFHLHHLLR